MGKLKAAIFDMDGVIFETERLWKESFERANCIFNLDLTETYRQSTCGKSEIAIQKELENMYPDLDVKKYRSYMLQYVNDAINNGEYDVKPGAIETIKMLRKKNYKVALATSSHKQRAEMLFDKKGLNLYELFDSAIFAEDVGHRSKPDPLIFTKAAMCVNAEPADCYVFEDSINGIEAAVIGGFVPIMVVDLIEPTSFCSEKCRKIIRSFKEIEGLIIDDENN